MMENLENEETYEEIISRAFDYSEALKRQNLKQEDIDRLREKVKNSNNIPKFIVDQQLCLFLNAANNDIEKAAGKLEVYYELKKTTPEFFSDRDVESHAIQASLDHQDYVALPVTPDNKTLFLHRLSSPIPQHYVFDEAVKTFAISVEAYLYHIGPRSGTIFVFDLKGVKFGHLFRPGVSSIRKGMRFLEDGSPLDIKAIHILNTVPFFDYILALVRPFSRSGLLSKVHFHSSNMNYDTFFAKHIPKTHMPSDFGGDLESVDELHRKHRKSLMELRNYFLLEERHMKSEYDKYVQ